MYWTKARRIKELEEQLAQAKFKSDNRKISLEQAYNRIQSEREFSQLRIAELSSEIKDLTFQRDTLDQLLKQLRINVKLPVRAK
jgi:chromosome segregation ATPase